MRGGEKRKPAGDVFLLERKGFSRQQNQRIENAAPADVVFVERIIKMLCADGVFGKKQRAMDWAPNRDSPVPKEFGKALGPPPLVSCRENSNVVRPDGQNTTQFAREFRGIA